MSFSKVHPAGWGFVLSGCLLFCGCGSGSESAEQAPIEALPTASVNPQDTVPELPPPTAEAEQPGTPEWAIREILKKRLQAPPDTQDFAAINTWHRTRNQEIVQLAEQAIAQTHDQTDKAATFTAAVHHLMEAQLQLAIQVDDLSDPAHQQAVKTLFANAEALHSNYPKTKAAAEAGFTLVKFSEIMARRFAENDPRWLEEYARQAQLFARNFPEEQARAVAKLDAAGWSCESYQMNELATVCYQEIANRFPEHPAASEVTAVLRRLRLPGNPVKLAGPTIDGGFVDVDDENGNVVLVAFWAAEVAGVDADTETIKQLLAKHSARGFRVIGVNLDSDEDTARKFLTRQQVTWPTIFELDPAKRRWSNPIVSYFGVRNIPTYWLIHRDGTVISTHIDLDTLDQPLGKLLAGEDS